MKTLAITGDIPPFLKTYLFTYQARQDCCMPDKLCDDLLKVGDIITGKSM